VSLLSDQQNQEQKRIQESLAKIEEQLIKVSNNMERTQIADYVDLMNRPFKLIWRNFLVGVSRGVGSIVGIAVFATLILYVLQMLGALNLPIVGDYIADLVRIVQKQLDVTD